MATEADTTAVDTYESMVRQAARLAMDLAVVLRSTVYVPPLTGSAVTTSA